MEPRRGAAPLLAGRASWQRAAPERRWRELGVSGRCPAIGVTTMRIAEALQRFLDWLRLEAYDPFAGASDGIYRALPDAHSGAVEYPWRYRWDHLPKRSAGFGFADSDYQEAKARAEEIARLTLGDELWSRVKRVGYVDLPSERFPGVTYRLRVGRRIEVRCAPGVRPPWSQPFLCINPTYPLPEAEFFAHLYLYARDNEDELIRVAAPQPWDQPLGRTF